MSKVTYHVLNESIVLNWAGRTEIISASDKRYDKVFALCKEKRQDEIPALLEAQEKALEIGGLELRDGKLWDGPTALPDALTSRIIKYRDLELDYAPLLKFWANLKANPSFNSRAMLYKFMENNGHPLTEDGCFIAYRGVREDFKDVHTGTFDNRPGQVLEMPRDQVDDNPDHLCSSGFHVACHSYAENFGQKLVEVKVNPIDVVAVPKDYNGTKMRVCKFEVIQECAEIRKEEVYNNPKSVYADEDRVEAADDEDEDETCSDCGDPVDSNGECEGCAEDYCSACGEERDAFGNYCAHCGHEH